MPSQYGDEGFNGNIQRREGVLTCKNCSRIGLVVAKSEEFWSRKRGVIGYVHNVKIINCKSSNWPLKGNSMIICCYRCGTKHSQERKDGEKGYPGHTCARDLT